MTTTDQPTLNYRAMWEAQLSTANDLRADRDRWRDLAAQAAETLPCFCFAPNSCIRCVIQLALKGAL